MYCARPKSKGGRGGRAGSKGSTECSSGGSEDEDGESESDGDEEDTDGDGEGSVRGNEETTMGKKKKLERNSQSQSEARTPYIRISYIRMLCAFVLRAAHLVVIYYFCVYMLYMCQGVCSCIPPGEFFFAGCTCTRKRKS